MDREDITPGKIKELPSVSDEQERKEILTQIQRQAIAYPSLIKTGHVLTAIDIHNKMDGIYHVPFGFNDNRVINFICDEETRNLIMGIGERTRVPTINDRIAEARQHDKSQKEDIADG